jgi:hypothetical protein
MIVPDREAPLPERVEHYLTHRLEQYARWYDTKAISIKSKYLRGRVTAAVGAVTVPVLTNVSLDVRLAGHPVDLSRILVTAIGLTVAVLIALEGVLHHREQWKNYRTTEQYLRAHRIMFENGVGEYESLDPESAFRRLVLNVESAIKNENEVTLNVLTRVDNGSERGGV